MLRDLINAYKQAIEVVIARRFTPKSPEEAERRGLFWSRIYMLTSFTALVYIAHDIFVTGKLDKIKKGKKQAPDTPVEKPEVDTVKEAGKHDVDPPKNSDGSVKK